jgi:hypothetical protein
MAGMRLLLLLAEIAAAYSALLTVAVADTATATLPAVPLWKVIAGPVPVNFTRTRSGSGFFC